MRSSWAEGFVNWRKTCSSESPPATDPAIVDNSPLALCDATTIDPADLIVSDLIYRDRVGETYALRFNPDQRWAYFPHMTPDEAVLIKGYDSTESGVARFTAHSAFEDPATRTGTPERESIEARAIVIYSA